MNNLQLNELINRYIELVGILNGEEIFVSSDLNIAATQAPILTEETKKKLSSLASSLSNDNAEHFFNIQFSRDLKSDIETQGPNLWLNENLFIERERELELKREKRKRCKHSFFASIIGLTIIFLLAVRLISFYWS